MSAGRLPVMLYDGKYYYVDNRLKEARNINDFMDSIQFSQIDKELIEDYDIPWEKVKEHETWQKDFQ